MVLSSFLVFTLFSYSLLVQNIAADRLFTLQDQATAVPQKKLPAEDNQDDTNAEDSTDTTDQINPTLKRITSHNVATDPGSASDMTNLLGQSRSVVKLQT